MFCISYGYFKYQVMPFDLSNTPTSFQKYIKKLFAVKLVIFIIIYLDDILIYPENLGQLHVDAVH